MQNVAKMVQIKTHVSKVISLFFSFLNLHFLSVFSWFRLYRVNLKMLRRFTR